MTCPFLIAPVVNTCVANEKMYIPTSIQLEQYCQMSYYKCPFYRFSSRKMKGAYKRMRMKENISA